MLWYVAWGHFTMLTSIYIEPIWHPENQNLDIEWPKGSKMLQRADKVWSWNIAASFHGFQHRLAGEGRPTTPCGPSPNCSHFQILHHTMQRSQSCICALFVRLCNDLWMHTECELRQMRHYYYTKHSDWRINLSHFHHFCNYVYGCGGSACLV